MRVKTSAVTVLWVILTSSPGSQGFVDPGGLAPIQKDLRVDLDGNGHEDRVVFLCYSTCKGYGYDRFVLDINSVTSTHHGSSLTGDIFVVDVDSTDTFLELAVTEDGPSGDPATYVFQFHDLSLFSLGVLPDHVNSADGSGVLRTTCRGSVVQTWWYPCEFRIGANGKFEEVKQGYVRMDAPVVLKSELELLVSPTDLRPSVVLHPGTRATITLTDDEKWCKVETEAGDAGWFRLERSFWLPDGRMVSAVFDGLSFAD